MRIPKFILMSLLLLSLIAIYNYLWDLIFYHSNAVGHPEYLWGYFAYYLIFRAAIFIPIMFLYWYVFSKYKVWLTFKVVIVLTISSLLTVWIIHDDNVLSDIKYKNTQRFYTYNLTALTLVLCYELYVKALWTNNRKAESI